MQNSNKNKSALIGYFLRKMVNQFLSYFMIDLPSGKKVQTSESVGHRTMYVNFVSLYIKLLERKCVNTQNEIKKLEYCTTLAILDEEVEACQELFSNHKTIKNEESLSVQYEQECMLDERLRLYVTFGIRCREQYRLSGSRDFNHRNKGIKRAVRILLRIKRDVGNFYIKKNSSNASLLKRLLRWVWVSISNAIKSNCE